MLRDSRGRGAFVADEVFCFRVQVGDDSTTQRNTPVSVSVLGSGVARIALGKVRFVVIASGRYVVFVRRVCIRLIALLLCCGTRMCDMGWQNVRKRQGVFVTLWFAVSFLCAVQRRRGVMLGTQREWPSDACCFVFLRGAVA